VFKHCMVNILFAVSL